MRPDHEREFDRNLNQLIQLLKKILKNVPSSTGNMPSLPVSLNDSAVNINLCFFTFLPMDPEEMDELEEIYDQYLSHEDKRSGEWSTDLSVSDVEFLRRNGIRF